jgi:single-stranded-DNA-specific exonuclease
MPPPTTSPRLSIAPCDWDAVVALGRELGVSDVLAQVLVRRGHAGPAAARAFLDATDAHAASDFAGMQPAVDLVLRHVRAGARVTVHGDYDVDGVCSTAVLVRCLRRLGAEVDWFLPSRSDDGYGLARATVERLAARGTGLLITVDCGITAVEEVASARAAGLDVLVTDHHRPRPDGVLPAAPILHPAISGYPCEDLCATGVAFKLAEALEADTGPEGAERAVDDLDLVALATVADCVPLLGENRRLVREGMRVLAGTAKPGLRALMGVAQTDPSGLDAHALGFRLAPRINAAGRLYRADAGLELLLTRDDARAGVVAAELDRANAERRDVETRILFAAETQVAEAGERPAYVLAGEDWHPGVIGIVASRVAERHHRPAVLVALDRQLGTGSGRSIPGFDLLAGLTAAAPHLRRYGGHRAAAGLEVARADLDAFRAAFEAHAAAALSPEDLVPAERVDAVVAGDALGLGLAEELERLQPCGTANPAPVLLVPAATFTDPRAMGEGRHARFTVHAGGARARAVAFGVAGGRLPVEVDEPVDATFGLRRHTWNGAVEPQLELRSARASAPGPIEVRGEPADFLAAALAELERPLEPWPPPERPEAGERILHDRRDRGIAGCLGALVASGEPVLVVCADARRRADVLAERLGGFALCAYAALERDPAIADAYIHVFALDPPAHGHHERLLVAGPSGAHAHLGYGHPELRFARSAHEHEYGQREVLATIYRALRDRGGAAGAELEATLRGETQRPRSAAAAGRALRVLVELSLVVVDGDRRAVAVPAAGRTELERSPAFCAYERRYQDGLRWLSAAHARAA